VNNLLIIDSRHWQAQLQLKCVMIHRVFVFIWLRENRWWKPIVI